MGPGLVPLPLGGVPAELFARLVLGFAAGAAGLGAQDPGRERGIEVPAGGRRPQDDASLVPSGPL